MSSPGIRPQVRPQPNKYRSPRNARKYKKNSYGQEITIIPELFKLERFTPCQFAPSKMSPRSFFLGRMTEGYASISSFITNRGRKWDPKD
jgi:hypothetical protein